MQAEATGGATVVLSHEDISFLTTLAGAMPPMSDPHRAISKVLREAARVLAFDAVAVAVATSGGWKAVIGLAGPTPGAFLAAVRVETEKACAATTRVGDKGGGVLVEVLDLGRDGPGAAEATIGCREELADVESPACWAGMFAGSRRAFSPKHAVLFSLVARRVHAYQRFVEAYRRAEEESVTDPLTGCRNRRGFAESAAREVQRSRRYGYPLCLGLIDVDDLKHVNDLHGHAAGDQFLRAVAAGLRLGLRRVDVLARYGADEFVVLLPHTPPGQALVALTRALDACRRAVAAADGGQPPENTVASAGVTALLESDDLPSLLARADVALYVAKTGRRGCVALAP